MVHTAPSKKGSILALFLASFLLVGTQPSKACLSTGQVGFMLARYHRGGIPCGPPASFQQEPRALTCSTVRPEGGDSVWVGEDLETQFFQQASIQIEAEEPPASDEGIDLGSLEPTGRVNPDGTEVWVPGEESILAGSIEVDVSPEGRIIRQKVLRPQPASQAVEEEVS